MRTRPKHSRALGDSQREIPGRTSKNSVNVSNYLKLHLHYSCSESWRLSKVPESHRAFRSGGEWSECACTYACLDCTSSACRILRSTNRNRQRMLARDHVPFVCCVAHATMRMHKLHGVRIIRRCEQRFANELTGTMY